MRIYKNKINLGTFSLLRQYLTRSLIFVILLTVFKKIKTLYERFFSQNGKGVNLFETYFLFSLKNKLKSNTVLPS